MPKHSVEFIRPAYAPLPLTYPTDWLALSLSTSALRYSLAISSARIVARGDFTDHSEPCARPLRECQIGSGSPDLAVVAAEPCDATTPFVR